jgi:hypothetical protein
MFYSTRGAAALLTTSLLAFGLALLPGPWLPRFTYAPLNYWFTGVSALAMLIALLALGLALRARWTGIVLILLAFLLAIPLAPVAVITLMAASDQADPKHSNLRKLDEVSNDQYKYRLYQTDCGATCDYGLELRKELDVIHVAKLVSRLWSKNGEKSATLRFTKSGQLQVVEGDRILFIYKE